MYVTNFEVDFCSSGFERWARNGELLLAVHVSRLKTQEEMEEALREEYENGVIGSDLDGLFETFLWEATLPLWKFVQNQFPYDPLIGDEDERHLYIYLKVGAEASHEDARKADEVDEDFESTIDELYAFAYEE